MCSTTNFCNKLVLASYICFGVGSSCSVTCVFGFLAQIGFRTVEDLTSSLSGVSKGFDRQILAFKK